MSYVGRKSGRAALISADIPSNLTLLGSHVKIPTVTTANLPGAVGGTNASITAVDGMLVYNSTLGMLQQRSAGIWSGITTAPVITSFTYSDGASATAEKTVVGLVSVSCTTQTSTTVLVPGASLGIQVGMVVAGTGIPVGATVVSVIEDTSFVLSAAATASATVTLTFGGAVTITGTNFDSILAGGSANIAVTFDGTSATSISVNSLKTIITCTPPAHAAGTITLLITNGSGLTASTNFVYDVEPIFTTAAGSLGGFVENTVFTANASAPRIQGTESGVALTTGFQRVTSATDDTVITTALQGLTLQTSGYLTGTLTAGANATTYPFYATAKDNENQRTAPRLFNIISYDYAATGGDTIITSVSGYRIHVFTSTGAATLVMAVSKTAEFLVIAGGGAGASVAPSGHSGGGGGGAGGYRTSFGSGNISGALSAVESDLSLGAGVTYTVTVGTGGVIASGTINSYHQGGSGVASSISGSDITDITTVGGGGGGAGADYVLTTGGSGGGAGYRGTGGLGTALQGFIGGGGTVATPYAASGGGGAGEAGFGQASASHGGAGGDGIASSITGASVTRAGGGGGSGSHNGTGTAGVGGAGGGGDALDPGVGETGEVNTGSGGGGGGPDGSSTPGVGGAGGTGIVIIRYAV